MGIYENRRDPAYRVDPEMGQLFFSVGGREQIVGDTDLMIAWSDDRESPCLHKHGRPALVSAFLEKVRAIDPDMTSIVIPWEVIRHPEAGPRVIEEVNSCLAVSGRIGGIAARLAEITEGLEIQLHPRDDAPCL
jgi:hypothetical protein